MAKFPSSGTLLRQKRDLEFESNIQYSYRKHGWKKPEAIEVCGGQLFVTCTATSLSGDSFEGAVVAFSESGFALRVLAQGGGLEEELWALCLVPHTEVLISALE